MGITAITIENFKGIKDPVRIELKPITLLFGPNSAGKSTVIQALHYAREIFERGNLDPDKTISGGDAINLGGFQNLVHRQLKQGKEITLGFELDLTNETMPSYLDFDALSWIEKARELAEEEPDDCRYAEWQDQVDYLTDIPNRVKTAVITITIRWNELLKKPKPYVASYQVSINGYPFAKIEEDPGSQIIKLSYLEIFHPIFYTSEELGKIKHLLDKINTFQDETTIKESIRERFNSDVADILEESFGVDGSTAAIDSLKMIHKNELLTCGLLRRIFPESESDDTGDCYDDFHQIQNGEKSIDLCQDSALPNWDKSIKLESDLKLPKTYTSDLFVNIISSLIVGPGKLISKFLQETCYLGPLRELPSRDHRPNRSPDESRWAKGLAAYDTLFKADDDFIKKVNDWLTQEERLHSSYSVKVKKYRELEEDSPLLSALLQNQNLDNVKDLWESLSPKRRLLFLDEKMNMELAPQDIGVGISQVLPVIVAALSAESGIVAIEQPELHIHPAFQVALGDIFIEQIRQHPKVTFLLETHSEHLLLRLLRRIRDTYKGVGGSHSITPDDISVLFATADKQGSKMVNIPVAEDGDFESDWPEGFFEEREKELFD